MAGRGVSSTGGFIGGAKRLGFSHCQLMIDFPAELRGRPFTALEAKAHGITRRMLQGPRIVQIFAGAYRSVDTPDSFDLRVRAAILVLPADATLSHVSNLRWRGYGPVAAWPLHFSTNAKLHVERRGIVPHRRQGFLSSSFVRGVSLLGPDRTFVDAATQLSERELLRVGDWLVANKHTDILDLRAFAVTSHLDGVQRARRVAPVVREKVDSERESDVRWIILSSGLPVPEPNPDLLDDCGQFLAKGDLVYSSFKVLVEYDGWQHERDAVQRQRDHLRREQLEAQGWRVIVVTAEDFRQEWSIAWRVYNALRQRGYTGCRPRFGR